MIVKMTIYVAMILGEDHLEAIDQDLRTVTIEGNTQEIVVGQELQGTYIKLHGTTYRRATPWEAKSRTWRMNSKDVQLIWKGKDDGWFVFENEHGEELKYKMSAFSLRSRKQLEQLVSEKITELNKNIPRQESLQY